MSDVRTFPLHAVLTKEEIAKYLSVSIRQIERLDLPVTYLGDRTPRYILRRVLEELERREVA